MKTKARKIVVNSQLLVDYLKSNHLSKKDFAVKCGISLFKLEGFLKGNNVGSLTLYQICKYTKISADDLVDLYDDDNDKS